MDKAVGSNTDVFIECFTREYEAIMFKKPEIQQRYIVTGTDTVCQPFTISRLSKLTIGSRFFPGNVC